MVLFDSCSFEIRFLTIQTVAIEILFVFDLFFPYFSSKLVVTHPIIEIQPKNFPEFGFIFFFFFLLNKISKRDLKLIKLWWQPFAREERENFEITIATIFASLHFYYKKSPKKKKQSKMKEMTSQQQTGLVLSGEPDLWIVLPIQYTGNKCPNTNQLLQINSSFNSLLLFFNRRNRLSFSFL